MSATEKAVAFLKANFRSAWALEVLLFMRAERATWIQPSDLVSALRASDLVVRQSVDSLAGAGLIETGESGVRYAPATQDLDDLAAEVLRLYVRSPALVRRIIVVATTPGIAAFSDAFRLKKE